MNSLLFIHGAWHWSGCWYKIVNSSLFGDNKIYALDNIGNGFSKGLEAENFDEYTSNIQELINNTKGKFVIISHSMGGSIANFIANKFPHKIEKIIYVAAFMCAENKSPLDYIMSDYYTKFMQQIGAENWATPIKEGKYIKLHLDKQESLIKLFYNQSPEMDIDIALKNLSELNFGMPFAYRHTYCEEFYSVNRVYVECTNDNAVPIVTQRQMQKDFPGAKIYTLEADHSPFFSKDRQLSEIIRKEISPII
jgi:pimeloyl-ACP methyl ester carboxylesterase